ncbi:MULTISPECIES: glutathione transferase GstA [unclassified Beijerinckia]|uniref:glutathione transferase GstA n=1 Tax=unclassified Beijerinckia TaxID=2638183 RepID=UPI000895F0C3|nr:MULTISPECIES: glutathione transferase GstA [unclassified Beijerinckia]MDH7795445.1 glutathione S-transferase [Beijerinckia sp. GAS462]SEC01874.1 glutathione S-transferase [Beijerinckia sp. 28-YEA-48]
MKLYYAAGTCSLAPHIVANEADITLDLERVDLGKMPRLTDGGVDYATVNPNLYVPALRLDDGAIITEGVAIMQYLADYEPESKIVPPSGTLARVRLEQWLVFISTELHKMYSPWLFHPEHGAQAQAVARDKIAQRLAYVDGQLATNGPFLLGLNFSPADAYLFTIVGWSQFTKVDLTAFPYLRALMDRVAARPSVRDAMLAQGFKVAA